MKRIKLPAPVAAIYRAVEVTGASTIKDLDPLQISGAQVFYTEDPL